VDGRSTAVLPDRCFPADTSLEGVTGPPAALRQEVACAWAPMAVRLARRFRHRGESIEDLTQVARLGLVKAVTRFDPSRGTTFPGFAIPTIVGEVKLHFRDHLWCVHVPRRVRELRGRVRTASHECASLYGRQP
jgi:RNA polymerase sigma-B factor